MVLFVEQVAVSYDIVDGCSRGCRTMPASAKESLILSIEREQYGLSLINIHPSA